MRTKAWLLLAAFVSLLMGGCWDRTELEDQGQVVAIALDEGAGGSVKVTLMLALAQSLGGMNRSPDTPLAAEIMSTEGATINQAVHILNGVSTRRLGLKHLRAVLVGEALARSGLEPLVMELQRNPEARETLLLAQTRGNAGQVLSALHPVGEVNPARMVEGLIMQAKYFHLAPPVRLQHFVTRLGETGIDPILPVLALNQGRGGDASAAPGRSALPGELNQTSSSPVDYVGTAVFRKDRLAGLLTVDETQMLLALRGEMGKAYMTFPDPMAPGKPVTLRFHQENLPQHRTAFTGGRPQLHSHILFEGEVLALPGGVDYTQPAARAGLERAAASAAERTMGELMNKLKRWGADPVGVGLKFRRKFLSVGEWKAYGWSQRASSLLVDVSVEMRIRRYGLLLGPDRAEW